MLTVENLCFSYGSKKVLKGITFKLNNGIGCILGLNGAGKSSLLKCIAGVLNGNGEIILNGIKLSDLSPIERSKFVSYSPQEFSINFPYTVFEMILMGRNPHINPLSGPKRKDEEIVWKSMRSLGIEEFANKVFTDLSGGQKRLVMIARAIAQGGKLFLFDEPTSFLDFRNQYLILSTIRNLAKNVPILISLHDPNQALTFCDYIFLIKDGKIADNGIPKRILTEENLMRFYGIKTKKVEISEGSFLLPLKLMK